MQVMKGITITVSELARFLGRHVVTVRVWAREGRELDGVRFRSIAPVGAAAQRWVADLDAAMTGRYYDWQRAQ